MKHTLFLLIIISFITTQTSAAGELSPVLINDTLDIEFRQSNVHNRYAQIADFDYNREPVQEAVSFWDKLWNWFFNILDLFHKYPILDTVFKIILIGLIVFLIIKLLGYQYSGFWLRKRKIKGAYAETYDEDIHRINFEEEIKKALQENDFRKALRFRYLYSLKLFSDAEIISWEPDKTNREYQKEIKMKGFGESFSKVTVVYEHVWYGDFDLNKAEYEKSAVEFDSIRKRIKE